jgi:hypothetical protein
MDTTNTKFILGFLVAVIILVGGIAFIASRVAEPTATSPYDVKALAQCLKDKGAVFYGAFWCPHCQATKALFGDARSDLPYVECSRPDRSQLPICNEKAIENYPTWDFPNGTRMTGELTLEQLAQNSSCPLIPLDGSAPIILEPATTSSTTPVSTSTDAAASTSPVL